MYLKRLFGIICSISVLSFAAAGPDARLADAAKASDKAAIRALIAKHADVNSAQLDGTTALHWSVYHDDRETAQMLIGAGANVKMANRYGVTPLTVACTNGNAEIVKLLLKAGADPNTTASGGETALMTAARTGNVETVNALLSAGADVGAKESQKGQTAVMWAATEGHAEVVDALIKAGADFRARLNSGFTPLLLAVREGRIGVVKTLLKAGADVNETIQPVSVPVIKGYVYSREKGPRAGSSALHMAVANAHYELGSVLLDAGADPNAIGPGYTALHTVTWIRKSGAGDNDPSPQGSGNMTSLEFVKKLVAHGANLNARMTKRINFGLTQLNSNGATAFFLAARTADADLMRALAALGADPLLPNTDNSTPLMAAAGLGTRSPGEDAGTESEVIEAMQAALDLGADINAVDNNGETAMHGAAYKNLPTAVQFLVDKGANIEVWNRKNKREWTPLLIAEGYRFGNFKPSPETSAAIQKAMRDKGVSTAVVPPPDREKELTANSWEGREMHRRTLLKSLWAPLITGVRLASAGPTPQRVVISGAGIIGASIAYHLAQRGAQVILLEKQRPGNGATRNSFAWLNALKQPQSYYELNVMGILGWHRLATEIAELQIQWGGSVRWVSPGSGVPSLQKRAEQFERWGYPMNIVDQQAFARLLPQVSPGSFGSASFSSLEGTVDPMHALIVLLHKAQQFGVKVEYPCEVTGLDMADGRVRRIQTTRGPMEADVVVLASGVNTPQLARMAGVAVPLKESSGLLAHSTPQARILDRVALGPGADIKQNLDGRIVTGVDFGPSDTTDTSLEAGKKLFQNAERYVEKLKGVAVESVTLGYRVLPLDGFPIVGFPEGRPNLYIAAMHSGMTMCPIIGQLAAMEILDGATVDLLTSFRLSRFSKPA